jgi:hypothetical protein
VTATTESCMQLARAIRERHQLAVKQSILIQFDLRFGAPGLMLFRPSLTWRSLATCKKLSAGEHMLMVA